MWSVWTKCLSLWQSISGCVLLRGEAMSVPVLGSLVALLLLGLILPHKLRVQTSALLNHSSIQPRVSFLLPDQGRGLCGISLRVPSESRLCDSCGGDLNEDFHYEWKLGRYSDERYALHDSCMIGYSSLYGSDQTTLAALKELWDEYGPMLSEVHPHLATSLLYKLDTMRSLCHVPNQPSKNEPVLPLCRSAKRPKRGAAHVEGPVDLDWLRGHFEIIGSCHLLGWIDLLCYLDTVFMAHLARTFQASQVNSCWHLCKDSQPHEKMLHWVVLNHICHIVERAEA